MKTKTKVFLFVYIIGTLILALQLVIDNIELRDRVASIEYEQKIIMDKLKSMDGDMKSMAYEQELFMDIASKEFEYTWRSFARVRENFRAIGYSLKYGLQLSEKDVMIENEDQEPEE